MASIRQKEALLLAEKVNASPKISGILLGFPPYILPSQKEVKLYVEAIAKVIDKPIILYNNPRRTGFNLELDTFAELIKLPNILGIKEAGDSERIPELISAAGKKIYVYAGGEIDLDQKIALGATRLSSMAGNLYPKEVELYFLDLLHDRADKTKNAGIEDKIHNVFAENPIFYIKNEITKQTQIDMGIARSPLGNQ